MRRFDELSVTSFKVYFEQKPSKYSSWFKLHGVIFNADNEHSLIDCLTKEEMTMKKSISVSDITELSIAERIQFVEDVWDSIGVLPEQVDVSEPIRQELNRRIDAYHRKPDHGSPWKEVKQRILAGA
jgi:putative addiction module component (TIGR02574 family)